MARRHKHSPTPVLLIPKQSLQFQLICFRQRGGFSYEMGVLFKQIQPEMYNLQGPFARTNAQQILAAK